MELFLGANFGTRVALAEGRKSSRGQVKDRVGRLGVGDFEGVMAWSEGVGEVTSEQGLAWGWLEVAS